MWRGDAKYSLFDVSKGSDKYVVNLEEKTCAYRRWDLWGIPCCHEIARIWKNNVALEDYVHL